jgi:hypothetical protein
VVSTTPGHLADASSLYREDNAFSGNLITVQRFFKMPFTVDLHFGYRDTQWTITEMDTESISEKLTIADSNFNKRFNETFFTQKEEGFLTDSMPTLT